MKIRFYVFKKKKNLTLIISKFSKKKLPVSEKQLLCDGTCQKLCISSQAALDIILWAICTNIFPWCYKEKNYWSRLSLWKESCTYSSAREVFKTPKHTFSVFSSFKNLRQKQLRVAVTYLCTIITPSVQRTATGNEVVPWVL